MLARRRSVLRWILLVVAVLAGLFVLATARLFVWPPSDRPARVDAVVALGGDPGQLRAKEAVQLARGGAAPVVVVSRGGYPEAPCPRPVVGLTVTCFRAQPLNTRGEAEYVSRLAAKMRWHRIIVVSERSQTTRARLLFERCTGVTVLMVPVADPGSRLLYDVAYEWAALAKALTIVRSC